MPPRDSREKGQQNDHANRVRVRYRDHLKADLVSVIEASYAACDSPQAWLTGVVVLTVWVMVPKPCTPNVACGNPY